MKHWAISICLIGLTACDRSKPNGADAELRDNDVAPSGVSIVDEIYGLSQALDTDGHFVTVRGWLDGDITENNYILYNACRDAPDPFDVSAPKIKAHTSYLVLTFENPPMAYWVGQYVNIAGHVMTEENGSGHRIVSLVDAQVVSKKFKSGEGERIPYRIEQAEQDGADKPATAPLLESDGNDNPNPESKERTQ